MLQRSEWPHWTSDSPIATGLAEIYRTKQEKFLLFLAYFLQCFFPSLHKFMRKLCFIGVPANASTIAGVPAVAGDHAVTLAIAFSWRHYFCLRHCCCWHSCCCWRF